MYIDKDTMLASSQSITSGTSAVSQNTIDLSQARDIGIGNQKMVMVNVETALAGTVTTMSFDLIVSANADLSSPDIIGSSGSLAKAGLIAGKQFYVPIPPIPAHLAAKRYFGLNFKGDAAITAFIATAAVVESGQHNKAYASAGA
jgi:hypothetical protein